MTSRPLQVAGVDHHAKILPLKMADGTSESPQELQALVAALEYLVANPGFAQVVNMSVATYSFNSMLFDALTAAATTHILIGASGNTSGVDACVGLPNSHLDVITIGATDSTDTLGSFSSTGACLDFVAPGVGIFTASFDSPASAVASHSCTGTSCATPVISGIASLSLSVNPEMSKDELYEALKASAVDLGVPGRDNTHGWGRPNAYGTLDAIRTIFRDGFETGDTSRWTSQF